MRLEEAADGGGADGGRDTPVDGPGGGGRQRRSGALTVAGVALGGVVLALLWGLRGLAGPHEPGQGDAFTRLGDGHVTVTHEVTPDIYMVNMAEYFEVEADVVVEEAQPLRIDEGLTLVASVVSFMERNDQGWPGHTGWGCTDRWPPEQPLGPAGGPSGDARRRTWGGRLYPVEGLRLQAGDVVAVSFVTKAPRAGEWRAEGLRLRYRGGGRTFEQTFHPFAQVVEAGDETACDPTQPSGFLE